MQLFACEACGNLLFFDNSLCLACQAQVGFDPDSGSLRVVNATDPTLRHCQGGDPNCNWLVATNNAEWRCRSCRTTVEHPAPGGTDGQRWAALERAKRRVLYGLIRAGLALDGLTFAFPPEGTTGHADGLITVVLPEADDVERERRRVALGEPARSLVGHFRHECGHFYFDRLIVGGPFLNSFRALFGDERADYGKALKKHYHDGAPDDWEQRHVSSYASSHPWEDWAETWAHGLLIADALEIAAAYGLALSPHVGDQPASQQHSGQHQASPHSSNQDQRNKQPRTAEPRSTGAAGNVVLFGHGPSEFDAKLAAWPALCWFANSLNRSVGLHDWYPFVLSPTVIEKLRFIHAVVQSQTTPSPLTFQHQHQQQQQNQSPTVTPTTY